MPYEVSVYVIRNVNDQELLYEDRFITDIESPFYIISKVLNDLNINRGVDVEATSLLHEHYYVHITGQNIQAQIFINPVEDL